MNRRHVYALAVGALFALTSNAAPASDTKAGAFVRADDEKTLSDQQLLGKRLFEDANLSEPRGMSCMSCHAPERAFQGNNGSSIAAVAAGAKPGAFGARKVPTLMYKSFSPPFGFHREKAEDGKEKIVAKGGQFWDGRARDLAEQASGPLLDPNEMNNPSIEAVVEKVKTGAYGDMVVALHGPAAFDKPQEAMGKLTAALAAFQSSPRFAPFSSKFDDALRGAAKLSPEEARGFAIFKDPKKGNCMACHPGKEDSKDPADWLFTDFTYDSFGLPRNAAIPANAEPTRFDLGLCKRPDVGELAPSEVDVNSLCGAFKVPTLRNVAVTGPYYHNGAIASLRDAVAFYFTRDTHAKRWFPKLATGEVDKFDDLPGAYKANVNASEAPYDRKPGEKPRASDREIDALVAFLKTLTDKGMR